MLLRILCIFILSNWSCSAAKKTLDVKKVQQTASAKAICFVLMNVKYDSIQDRSIASIVNVSKSSGTFKDQANVNLHFKNRLLVTLTHEKEMVKSIVIEHPLYKDVEYTDHEQLLRKSIKLKEADVFFRLMVEENKTYTIKVSEQLDQNKPVTLLIQKI